MKYTSDCVHVTNTSTGAGASVFFAGQAYRDDGTVLANITSGPIAASAADHRGAMRWMTDGRLLLNKLDVVDGSLFLPGAAGKYASTPDSAQNSVTSDLDIRVKLSANDWTPSANQTIISKWLTTGNQRAYKLSLVTTGVLRLMWSTNGTAEITKDSTVATAIPDGEWKWVRVTLDVISGANNDVAFYTSNDGSTWTQLGTTVVTAGNTSIFDSTAVVQLSGYDAATGTESFAGRVSYAEVRSGIAGTVVALFDPGISESGAATVANVSGQTAWTITAGSTTPYASVVKEANVDNGEIRNADGVLYAATAAVAGAVVNRYIHKLPYDAAGRLKVNEV